MVDCALESALRLSERIEKRGDLLDHFVRQCETSGWILSDDEHAYAERVIMLSVEVQRLFRNVLSPLFPKMRSSLFRDTVVAFDECLSQWPKGRENIFDYPWSPLSRAVCHISVQASLPHKEIIAPPDVHSARRIIERCLQKLVCLEKWQFDALQTQSPILRNAFRLLERIDLREDLVDDFRAECKRRNFAMTMNGDMCCRAAILNTVNATKAVEIGSRALISEAGILFLACLRRMIECCGPRVPFDYPYSPLSRTVWMFQFCAAKIRFIIPKHSMTIDRAIKSLESISYEEWEGIGDDAFINLRQRSSALQDVMRSMTNSR